MNPYVSKQIWKHDSNSCHLPVPARGESTTQNQRESVRVNSNPQRGLTRQYESESTRVRNSALIIYFGKANLETRIELVPAAGTRERGEYEAKSTRVRNSYPLSTEAPPSLSLSVSIGDQWNSWNEAGNKILTRASCRCRASRRARCWSMNRYYGGTKLELYFYLSPSLSGNAYLTPACRRCRVSRRARESGNSISVERT